MVGGVRSSAIVRFVKVRLPALFLVLLLTLAAGCSDAETTRDDRQRPAAENSAGAQREDRSSGATEGSPNKQRPSTAPNQKPREKRPVAVTMLKRLRVASEDGSGYRRDHFKHWTGGSCDTRKRVLSRENRKSIGSSCDAHDGVWYSPYDSVKTTDPSSFDIDHVVPLAEAWRSGASRWTSSRREAFANDLHPYSLIAVTASSNRQKGDRDPTLWLPGNRSFVCSYVARWIAVKFRWRLSVDRAEKATLSSVTGSCPNRKLKLTRKVPVTGKPTIIPSAPASKSTQRPKPRGKKAGKGKQGGSDPIFGTCAEAKANGFGPYQRGRDPEYDHYIDRDNDGIACE